MLTQEIRRKFLDYFRKHQHAVVASSPVVPHDDPTLLFTNAGMNQFKDVFLGKSQRDYRRATTSQKCVRVGGKHNDLENVGHTSRHLTFFEMLGNFSFGDYFKKEAIRFAWEVSTEVIGFDPNRIWPTIFLDDDEAFEIWRGYVPAERITRLGEKDNFWAMGDTGPCGPCSELYYDRGAKYGSAQSVAEDPDGLRFIEFWNLVFMQFNRQPDGSLNPLPLPSIDTGAGLERIISLKMDVDSLFETDVLISIITRVEEISGKRYDFHDQTMAPAFRVIADHLRCLSFAIADGVQPSNVDRGYVLRKILRRAVRYGRQLGLDRPFLADVLPALVSAMGSDYHELVTAQGRISEILTLEEEAFLRTLRRGGNLLSQVISSAATQGGQISGDDAFKLKDTYGLPIEEILLLAKDSQLQVDLNRYQALEQEAKERSRSAHKVTHQIADENLFAKILQERGVSQFTGYTQQEDEAKVIAIVVNHQLVEELGEGEEGMLILDRTPFYAEKGGQIGDRGRLVKENVLFEVEDTQSPYKDIVAHVGRSLKGNIRLGDRLNAYVDSSRRQRIANNHTATHLLHWALCKILGEHVKQAGSVVDASRLRFDFSHHKPLTAQEIHQLEDLVNQEIRKNQPVKSFELPYDEAQHRKEIKQFFGEKYGSTVRVIDTGSSQELCGGTHTDSLGNIGYFRIIKEGSIAAGVRRIEAVTGEEAEIFAREIERQLHEAATTVKTTPAKLIERLQKLTEETKELTQALKEARQKELKQLCQSLAEQVQSKQGVPLLATQQTLPTEELRELADLLMEKAPSLIAILGSNHGERAQILVRVSDDLVAKGIRADAIVKQLAPMIEGSGGGKPNNAQAGGKAPEKLSQAIEAAPQALEQLLNSSKA